MASVNRAAWTGWWEDIRQSSNTNKSLSSESDNRSINDWIWKIVESTQYWLYDLRDMTDEISEYNGWAETNKVPGLWPDQNSYEWYALHAWEVNNSWTKSHNDVVTDRPAPAITFKSVATQLVVSIGGDIKNVLKSMKQVFDELQSEIIPERAVLED